MDEWDHIYQDVRDEITYVEVVIAAYDEDHPKSYKLGLVQAIEIGVYEFRCFRDFATFEDMVPYITALASSNRTWILITDDLLDVRPFLYSTGYGRRTVRVWSGDETPSMKDVCFFLDHLYDYKVDELVMGRRMTCVLLLQQEIAETFASSCSRLKSLKLDSNQVSDMAAFDSDQFVQYVLPKLYALEHFSCTYMPSATYELLVRVIPTCVRLSRIDVIHSSGVSIRRAIHRAKRIRCLVLLLVPCYYTHYLQPYINVEHVRMLSALLTNESDGAG